MSELKNRSRVKQASFLSRRIKIRERNSLQAHQSTQLRLLTSCFRRRSPVCDHVRSRPGRNSRNFASDHAAIEPVPQELQTKAVELLTLGANGERWRKFRHVVNKLFSEIIHLVLERWWSCNASTRLSTLKRIATLLASTG